MTISPIIGSSYYNPYTAYGSYTGPSAAGSYRQEQSAGSASSGQEQAPGARETEAAAQHMPGSPQASEDGRVVVRNPGESTESRLAKSPRLLSAKLARTENIRTAPMRAMSPSRRPPTSIPKPLLPK